MPETPSRTDHAPVPAATQPDAVPAAPASGPARVERPAPDPTRYGDWEKNGRCIDF